MENEERKYSPLKILFAVLLFGGIWGIIEASVGTLLHMIPHGARTIFWSSTTVLLPIAYFLMGACYKKTGVARSAVYMGLFAGAIKLLSAVIFRSNYEPAIYMVIESACMTLALLAIRPKKVISFTGLGVFILASTSYLLATTGYRLASATEVTGQVVLDNITKYVLTYNCVAILYAFAIGAIIFGIIKLVEHFSWNLDSVKKVIYSPITAGVIASAMVVVTFLVR